MEALKKLIALGAINKKTGKVTNLGFGMSKFNCEPEYARIIIAGYNYGVVDKMCDLCAMLEIGNMNNFLVDLKPRDKKNKEKLQLFNLKRNEFRSDSDHVSMINIYNRYINEENKSEFCREYYLNKNNFSKVQSISKDFKNQIERLVKREKNYSNSDYLYQNDINFKDSSEKIRILAALSEGLFVNLFKKSKKDYNSCFPEKIESASIERSSFVKNVNIGIYTHFESIFGRSLFVMVSSLPNEIIDHIKKYKGNYFKKCI